MTNKNETLLTTSEAAELLKLHPDTLVGWRSSGAVQLPFLRVGRAVRYSRDEILEFLASERREK